MLMPLFWKNTGVILSYGFGDDGQGNAAAAMSFSSLSVVGNALRLRRIDI